MANSNSGDSVVDRVLRLIAAFPEGVTALPLSELAARAELPLTTAHRLVRQLAGHGLLDVGPGGSVSLGLRLWELANRNSPTLELRQAALPFMEDIQQVLHQNVNLAVLDGREALFVERLSRRGSVANRAQVAGRMPVHVSSAGLVLMANQPRPVQAEYLEGFSDPAGRLALEDLRNLLGEAAHRGYAQLAGVVDPDTWGIAVPVLDRRKHAVAALGVVVPLREVRLQALVPALQTAARGIGRAAGRTPRESRIPFSGIHVTRITPGGAHC
ncbi:IclR family transcriptional regulator [Arthrobacter sp. NicSoilC12]|uniref:IclR family transcriptional regulator n=1 Tax=Arthrobacter sp. NicSoilC12 TaxID=2831001 RepID=UPI001CC48E5F|nr:IclR family transcriptional regulator [Arthrobacter sp. NicSoilC12]